MPGLNSPTAQMSLSEIAALPFSVLALLPRFGLGTVPHTKRSFCANAAMALRIRMAATSHDAAIGLGFASRKSFTDNSMGILRYTSVIFDVHCLIASRHLNQVLYTRSVATEKSPSNRRFLRKRASLSRR